MVVDGELLEGACAGPVAILAPEDFSTSAGLCCDLVFEEYNVDAPALQSHGPMLLHDVPPQLACCSPSKLMLATEVKASPPEGT
eukprot:4613710-Prorocentrum_lima.AAC.1